MYLYQCPRLFRGGAGMVLNIPSSSGVGWPSNLSTDAKQFQMATCWKWIGKVLFRSKSLPSCTRRASSRQRSSVPFPFVELPAELKRSVANYLGGPDVLRLRQTCRKICSDLALMVHPPFQIVGENYWGGDDETSQSPSIATIIPIFYGNKTHSIILDCECFDDEPAMKFYVVAHHNEDVDLHFSSDSVIQELELRRRGTRSQLSFRPKDGKIHYLWYAMTSRPGSFSHVSAIRIYALVYNN